MINVALDEKEVTVIIKALSNCLKNCKSGGAEKGCDDCSLLEKVINKLKNQ